MLKIERIENEQMNCKVECRSTIELIEEVAFLVAFCKRSLEQSLEDKEDKINAIDYLRQSVFAGLDVDIDWSNNE